MTRFFQTTGFGEGFPVDDIVSLRWRGKSGAQPSTYLADLRDERTVGISDYTYRDVINPVVATIPAAPGYLVIVGGSDDGGDPASVWREPVIAWQVKQEGDVVPITIGGPWHDPSVQHAPIIQPDGRVFLTADETCFDTFDRYLAHVQHGRQVAAATPDAPAQADG